MSKISDKISSLINKIGKIKDSRGGERFNGTKEVFTEIINSAKLQILDTSKSFF